MSEKDFFKNFVSQRKMIQRIDLTEKRRLQLTNFTDFLQFIKYYSCYGTNITCSLLLRKKCNPGYFKIMLSKYISSIKYYIENLDYLSSVMSVYTLIILIKYKNLLVLHLFSWKITNRWQRTNPLHWPCCRCVPGLVYTWCCSYPRHEQDWSPSSAAATATACEDHQHHHQQQTSHHTDIQTRTRN